MKRFWLGTVLLIVLLAAGIGVTLGMHWVCDPVSRSLASAADAVQAGQWEQAEAQAQTAQRRWTHYRDGVAAIASHEPMEEVDALFLALDIFARQRDTVRFADCCARLTALTSAISESQSFSWWNVL